MALLVGVFAYPTSLDTPFFKTLQTKKKESEGNRHLDILRVLQSHLYHFLKTKKKEIKEA